MTDTPPAAPPRPSFWRALLTGPDNSTWAFGRVVAFAVVAVVTAVLVVGLPLLETALFWLRRIGVRDWLDFMASLTGYVPAILVALGGFATGLVALTNHTEPRP
jgi:hypothetical protein